MTDSNNCINYGTGTDDRGWEADDGWLERIFNLATCSSAQDLGYYCCQSPYFLIFFLDWFSDGTRAQCYDSDCVGRK